MPKSTNRKYITVRWYDHASNSTWASVEDAKRWMAEAKKNPCVTRGWIVCEDKDILVLADGHDGNGNIGNQTLIWKKLILKKGVKK